MKNIGIVYWSETGNTEKMAEHLRDTLEGLGANVYYSEISEVDEESFFENDFLIMGCSACGTEQINAEYFEPFIEDNGDEFVNKSVFLFGSYGWGGGEYIDTWADDLLSYGAEIELNSVICESAPTDETFEELEVRAEQIINM